MRYRFLYILTLLCCLRAGAQTRTHTLTGSLGVESGETFTYRLVLNDSAGQLSGYAVTYQQEHRDTRAAIRGTIDRRLKTLSFAETGIEYNNGFKSNAVICLIKSALKYNPEGSRFVLAGPVTSTDAGNASCARGSVRFEREEELRALFLEERKDTVVAPPARTVVIRNPQPVRPAVQPAPAVPEVPAVDEVTAGRERVYDWQTDTVSLELWDGGRIDGDIITVRYNGHTVLNRHTLTRERKRILLVLGAQGTGVITIVAENMGNEPPNTANLLLRDGAAEHAVVAYNDMGREAVIRIRKQEPASGKK